MLMHGEPLDRCDMSVGLMAALCVFAVLLQLFIAVGQTHLWIRREQRKKNRSSEVRNKSDLVCGKKLPLVPAFAWLILLWLTLWAVLVCLDIANSFNGVSTLLVGMIIVSYCVTALLLFLKFVSLGHNVIGVGGKWAAQQLGADQRRELTTFDTRGKIIVFMSLVALLGCFLSFCVFGFIFPNE
jgi:hypothetical protein